MYSGADLHKGGVSPFGYLRINDRSHLPAAFRSVPRPSSPLGAKASTERPALSPPTQPPSPHPGPNRAPQCTKPQTQASATNTHLPNQLTNHSIFNCQKNNRRGQSPSGSSLLEELSCPMGIERGERSLLDRQLVCKDWSQPTGIRPRRHNAFLERR